MAIVNLWTTSDADYVKAFVYKAGGVAVNLTGSTLRMMVRRSVDDPEVSIFARSDEVGAGIEITSAAGGAFTLHLPLARLARMPAGVYAHSLIRIRPDGVHEPVWRGAITHAIGPTR